MSPPRQGPAGGACGDRLENPLSTPSQVDCYTRFGDRVDDFALGAHLRRTILEPGATRDASVMISDFLGRAPSEKAYFDRLTASTPTEKKCARSE